MADLVDCPFCDYSSRVAYMVMLHVEEHHTDDSPFKVTDGPEAPVPTPPPIQAHPAFCTSQPHPAFSSIHQDAPSQDGQDDSWVLCPEQDCGEQVALHDLNEHLDLHIAEGLESQEVARSASTSRTSHRPKMHQTRPSIASEHSFNAADSISSHDEHRRHRKRRHHGHGRENRLRSDSEKSSLSRSILDILTPSSGGKKLVKPKEERSARLGKSELGPYAFEEQMPKKLYDQIKAGPRIRTEIRGGIRHEVVDNETPGVLPVLAQLCAIDRGVGQAYLCHPSTIHIFKRPNEGGFCGYRNIQMLVSYMQGAKAQGHDRFPPRTPGILVLQDLIEQAWDKGINEVSRIQTGGIRGTRKYIGTPEAQALLRSLRIDHGLQIFSDRPESQAHEQLLDFVENYFVEGSSKQKLDQRSKVVKTQCPPIYLQQPGHSITVVGLERHKDGTRNLLVLDPMFHTSAEMHSILGRRDLRSHRPRVLQAYRRVERQLRRHRDYEMISLAAHPPGFPAWDVLAEFVGHSYVYAFFHAPSLSYDIIPEERFPAVFPWFHYGGLFSTDDARFAFNPAYFTYRHDRDNLDSGTVEWHTDTGLLGGMPPLNDQGYMHWIGRYKRHAKSDTNEGFNKEARERINAALSGIKQQQDGHALFQEPLPEDVYFDTSVESAVPVHYPCGMALRRGYQHFTFRRCSPPWTHSSPESSLAPSSTASMSPEFDLPFQRSWRHTPQQGVYDNIPASATPPFGLVQDQPTATHHRRDSGVGLIEHIPSFKPTFEVMASTNAAGAHMTCPMAHQQQQYHHTDYPHDPQQHRQHISHFLDTISNNSIINRNPKSTPAPPVLNLGSVDGFSPAITKPRDNASPEEDLREAASWRARTPVAELRDFFFERSAETGAATPVFYGTGGSDVSRGWRAKMGAEW